RTRSRARARPRTERPGRRRRGPSDHCRTRRVPAVHPLRPIWPLASPSLRGASSADRRRILDAALGPQVVEPAGEAELGARADVALEHFAVIAYRLDDAHHPVLGQAELLAQIAFGADQPPDVRLVRLERLIEGFRRDAEFLGIDHGEVRPLD